MIAWGSPALARCVRPRVRGAGDAGAEEERRCRAGDEGVRGATSIVRMQGQRISGREISEMRRRLLAAPR